MSIVELQLLIVNNTTTTTIILFVIIVLLLACVNVLISTVRACVCECVWNKRAKYLNPTMPLQPIIFFPKNIMRAQPTRKSFLYPMPLSLLAFILHNPLFHTNVQCCYFYFKEKNFFFRTNPSTLAHASTINLVFLIRLFSQFLNFIPFFFVYPTNSGSFFLLLFYLVSSFSIFHLIFFSLSFSFDFISFISIIMTHVQLSFLYCIVDVYI